MNKALVALLKRTPGVILAGEALEDLADDIQAVIIKQLVNIPYMPQPKPEFLPVDFLPRVAVEVDPALADMQREFSNAA